MFVNIFKSTCKYVILRRIFVGKDDVVEMFYVEKSNKSFIIHVTIHLCGVVSALLASRSYVFEGVRKVGNLPKTIYGPITSFQKIKNSID